jgi:hypothetical protein
MDKDKTLTARNEHALTKSQQTGGLIDKHLGQLLEQKPRDSGEIHEIEFRGGKYTGQIKDGMPHGKGCATYWNDETEHLEVRRGEWREGVEHGFMVEQVADRGGSPWGVFIAHFSLGKRDQEHYDVYCSYVPRKNPEQLFVMFAAKRAAPRCSMFYSIPPKGFDPEELWPEDFDAEEPETAFGTAVSAFLTFQYDLEGSHTPETTLGLSRRRPWLTSLSINKEKIELDEENWEPYLNRWMKRGEDGGLNWHGPDNYPERGEKHLVWTHLPDSSTSLDAYSKEGWKGITDVEEIPDRLHAQAIHIGLWHKPDDDVVFTGLKFEVNIDLSRCRGPWFYKDGKKQKFDLFEADWRP